MSYGIGATDLHILRLLPPYRGKRHTEARIDTGLGTVSRVTQPFLLIDKRARLILPMKRVSLLISLRLVKEATARISIEMGLPVPDRTRQNEDTEQQFPQQWYHGAIGDERVNSQKPNMLKNNNRDCYFEPTVNRSLIYHVRSTPLISGRLNEGPRDACSLWPPMNQ